MKHKLVIRLVIFSLVLLTACSNIPLQTTVAEVENNQETNASVTIKAIVLPFLAFAPFFIAEEEGYFREQGLEVEYVKLNDGVATLPALIQGDLDIIGSTVNFGLLNGIARDGQLKIVADFSNQSTNSCASTALLTRQVLVDQGLFDDLSQLKGRSFATNPVGMEGFYLERILQESELTLDDLNIEDVPPPVLPDALLSGQMDVVNASEPWVTRILQEEGITVWQWANEIIPNAQWAVVLYGPNLLEKDPDTGKRFIAAYLKAVRQYNQGKTDRNIEIIAKHTELERDLLLDVCWPALRNDGQIDTDSILAFQSWGLEKALLDQEIPIEQFWDATYVDFANHELDQE